MVKLPRTTSGPYVVEAVAKALDLLDAFTNAEELTLNELSRRAALNKSRAFRLLHTLGQRGYVVRDADGIRYRLGLKLLERAANVHRNIRDVSRFAMLELQERFNETVNLGVLDDRGNVLYLDIAESSRPFRMTATVGCRMPAQLTSMGKAILAHMRIDGPASPNHGMLSKLSPRPTRALYRELEAIRQRGYAIDRGENEPEVGCLGAPIFDADGDPVAAISISGALQRILSKDKEKAIAEALLAACRAVSKTLGFEKARLGAAARGRFEFVAPGN
ncbi:MAG TPA: IclR family transcriptional regulator [Candidatus Bathyarchaeia archaeon]|jgi:IclR family acetate operon transcriptional repressor|nr:IclR family transcriptional regulator [Candidatus Bathyarchaeia archaeon]